MLRGRPTKHSQWSRHAASLCPGWGACSSACTLREERASTLHAPWTRSTLASRTVRGIRMTRGKNTFPCFRRFLVKSTLTLLTSLATRAAVTCPTGSHLFFMSASGTQILMWVAFLCFFLNLCVVVEDHQGRLARAHGRARPPLLPRAVLEGVAWVGWLLRVRCGQCAHLLVCACAWGSGG